MYNKLQVALEELDTLEQPQDALVTNESELEVAEVVEEIKEEAEELETTEELVEELEKQEAALENLIQGIKAVQNPTEDTVRLVGVAFENIITRIPEMEGRAALVDHDAIRAGVALEALANSTPEAVLAVALEEADKAKEGIMEKIKAFFKMLGEKIKHFFKLVSDSVYRLENAVKKLEIPKDYKSAQIKSKTGATLAGTDTAKGADVISGVNDTLKFVKDYTGNYASLRRKSLQGLVTHKGEVTQEVAQNFLKKSDGEFGEQQISGGRKVTTELGAIKIGKAFEASADATVTLDRSELAAVIQKAREVVKAVQSLTADAKVLESTAKTATEELKRDVAAAEGSSFGLKLSVLTRITNTGLLSSSKLIALLSNDAKDLVSLANAAIKNGGEGKSDDKK